MINYMGMKETFSYPFIDLPYDSAKSMMAIIKKLGWDIGGGPPPQSFGPSLPLAKVAFVSGESPGPKVAHAAIALVKTPI